MPREYIKKIGPWGGNGGNYVDIKVAPLCLNSITIKSGRHVYSLEFSCIDEHGVPHHAGPWGGVCPYFTDGDLNTIQLDSSEFLTGISGTIGSPDTNQYKGRIINSLTFITNARQYGPFGGLGGTPFRSPVMQSNSSIVGFFGRCGDVIDAIGLYVNIVMEQWIYADTIKEAVERILPYLEDTSNAAHKAIYYDGWRGLAASAVLSAIAKDPPPSLLRKFNKIIHVDCSRWKCRRALQRQIVQELKLPRQVMDVLDRQDEEDDFRGVDEGSRDEIRDVGAEIFQVLMGHKCLVIFHNGSNDMVNLSAYGIPQGEFFYTKVIWTFRGRLRLNTEISENVDNSHLYLYDESSWHGWKYLLQKEAREIAGYNTDKFAEAVEECCLYLLSLNSQGGNIMDYNWTTHASNYWVCDGIIEGGQADQAWEAAAAIHQQIHIEDYSSGALPSFGHLLEAPPNRWISARDNLVVHPESTSFFLAAVTSGSDPPFRPLPNDMFHQSDNLRVLKLCRCTFSFSSPPFHCCRSLRFLGLDGCKDQGAEEVDKQDGPAMDFFKSLWVLDICYTDWELDLSLEIIEQMAANIREVHIKKGRFWHMNFAWRQLQNLHKLRVIDPTCSWDMGVKVEFTVLPSLSTSNSLRTLVLDGCVGLEHVEGLPLSLESFNLDAGPTKVDYRGAKISRISLAGCARLSHFELRGSLPNLIELDISGTKVKTLDLRTQVVQVPCLQRVMLLGCEQLRAVLWPKNGMPQLSLLCIDTRGEEIGKIAPDLHNLKKGHGQAYFAMVDMKFIQLLVQTSGNMFWNTDSDRFSLNLYISSSVRWCNKEKMGPGSSWQICPPRPKSLIPKTYRTYTEVAIDNIVIDHDCNRSLVQFQPSGYHVEIGEGISNTSIESIQVIKTIIFVMDKAESLHVHDNSSITTVIPENMISIEGEHLRWRYLKQCHVARCPKMHTVFITNYDDYCFQEIETFWGADLLMAHCIWSKGRSSFYRKDSYSFVKLRSIHLYSCPRLTFVLQLWWQRTIVDSYFPNIETLHIVNCGDLVQVFLVDPEFLGRIATGHRKGILNFPNLKHIYLHELYKLQHICEAKIFAPKLEKARLRGCWSLRRLPAVGRHNRRRPVVDCEKDWWEKLEWDGLEAGHDPSLFEPRHSAYYKKPLPRVSVLR